jgi:CubicO group peptidase (beta-lactamase class C family)
MCDSEVDAEIEFSVPRGCDCPRSIAGRLEVCPAQSATPEQEEQEERTGERLQDILRLTPPPQRSINADFAALTLQEILEFHSGLPGGNPSDADVQAAFHIGLPVPGSDVARVVACNPLADPTKTMAYSNLGYFLLGLVVATVRRSSFIDAVSQNIFSPIGINRVRLSSPLLATTYPDEARYDRLARFDSGEQRAGLWLGRSVMTNDHPLVPALYGDRNLWNEDASGGLSTSAVDFARLIAALNVASSNPILRRASLQSMLQLAADNFNAHSTATDRRAGYGFDSMGLDSKSRFTGFKGVICSPRRTVCSSHSMARH